MLLFNCENEKFDVPEQTEITTNNHQIEHLSGADVPHIINAIPLPKEKSNERTNGSNQVLDYKKALINLKKVIKVKNADNVTNYTLEITMKDTLEGIFYNLIVNETPNGKIKDPYILKYTVDKKALPTFLANNRDFRYFKGKRQIIAFKDFFNDEGWISRTAGDCPDGETTINNTGGGGNGGFYDIDVYNFIQTDPTYYQYADYTTTPQSYTLYFNSYNTTTNDPTSHVDQVTDQLVPISTSQSGPMEIYVPNSIIAGVITVPVTATVSAWYETTQGLDGSGSGNCMMTVTLTHADGTKTSFDVSCAVANQLRTSAATTATECPDGEVEGEIGIVKPGKGCAFFGDYVDGGDGYCYPLSNYVDPIVACVGTLTQEQVDWLNDAVSTGNGANVLALYNYLQTNGCHHNTAGFTEEAIVALMNGGEFNLVLERLSINSNSYPGKEDGLSFNWWNDENQIESILQDPYEDWKRLTQEEKQLTKNFPNVAYLIRKNKTIAFQKTFQLFGNTPQNLNGKPDAFRHAFFQAINTVSVRKYFTKLFADAHESETPQIWQLEKQMDLFNNEIGMDLIEFDHPNWTDIEQIANEILDLLNTGELVYLSPIDYTGADIPGSPFWDNPTTPEPDDGTHGITLSTTLIPTDQ